MDLHPWATKELKGPMSKDLTVTKKRYCTYVLKVCILAYISFDLMGVD